MCGIAGAVYLDPDRPGTQAALDWMLASQVHRGPDDGGTSVFRSGEGTIGLGSRRLAILDLSPLGHQPMVNPDTGDVLVYNGEIYNSPDLRCQLQAAGYAFRGHSDTEVLLRAYEQWGMACPERLRGMFAFALWDKRRRRLVLARDPLGIKPLYYAALPGAGFIFASEVRALLARGLLPFAIDRRALAGYLAYGAVQEPLTIAEGVTTLAPGSWVEVDPSGQVAAQGVYWRLPAPEARRRGVSLEALVEEGRALLQRAVRRHLLSDVPVGVFLSSGLDSTAIAGLAQRVAGEQVHSFNVSFSDQPELDEAPLARDTASRLGVVHHECAVDAATARQWTLQSLQAMDQPAMDGLNTYIVSRAVREQGLVVALSGQGGDEIFGGYRSFRQVPRWYRWVGLLQALPPSWREALAGLATARLNGVARDKARDIARTGYDLAGLYFQDRRLISDRELFCLGLRPTDLGLDNYYQLPAIDPTDCLIAGDLIASVARLEATFYLRNLLLRDSDVFGMANSVEIRVPFLDQDVVEWALRLPGDVLLPPGSPGKFLLRQICAEFYTPSQLRQPKRGFSPPLANWLLGPLGGATEAALQSLKESELLEPAQLDALRARFLREPRSAAWSRVWSLVTLGYWLQRRAGATLPAASHGWEAGNG